MCMCMCAIEMDDESELKGDGLFVNPRGRSQRCGSAGRADIYPDTLEVL